MKQKKSLVRFLFSGVIIGATMTIPGVSGGSMAMILGVYDKLLQAAVQCFKEKRERCL